MITYDKNGNCTKCGLPGSGFVNDGVCQCGEAECLEDALAFSKGREGYFHGMSNVDNPYTGHGLDGLEEAWNEGYFDAFDEATNF